MLKKKIMFDLTDISLNTSKDPSSSQYFWFQIFGCSVKTLQCVVHEILDLLENEKLDGEKGVYDSFNFIKRH
jgi:hypothetical protein